MSEDEIKPQEQEDATPPETTPQTQPETHAETHDDPEAIPEELHPKPEEIRAIVEALTFVSKEPVTMKELARVFKGVDKAVIEAQLEELKTLYAADNRGLQFIEVAGGYQIT